MGVGGVLEQPVGLTAAQALRQALDALHLGRHDARLAEGAQANALESIAWSLIGILSQQTEPAPAGSTASASDEARRSMSEELRRRGFLHIDPQ